MQGAISVEDACGEVATFIKDNKQDGFLVGNDANNPWVAPPAGAGGCCSTM